VRVVTPVFHVENEPEPTFICTSYVNPVWVADVSVIVNVVDVEPVEGEIWIGTFTIPFIKVGWIAQ
jgi:hypothetical protein